MPECCSTNVGKNRVCAEGAEYVQRFLEEYPGRIAVVSCEGACVKGEVARLSANMVSYRRARDKTVRICLGDAVTANSGFSKLVERAPRIIAIEGCPLCCGTVMLRQRFPDIKVQALIATNYYEYAKDKFEIFDMDHEEATRHATAVSDEVMKLVEGKEPAKATNKLCC